MTVPFQQQTITLRRHLCVACWLGLLLLFCLSATGVSAATVKRPLELLNTIEFRGSLKALPKWKQVVKSAQQQIEIFNNCRGPDQDCSSAARSWLQMNETARSLQPAEQLKWINQFFNRWPYRLDLETYGLRDYWASPKEFMQFSGDCEDYSICKYFALRQLGYSSDQLRIIVVKDTIRNMTHAVLAVYGKEQIYFLDNLSDLVLPHNRYQHYLPQYSVNEDYRWAHIRKTNRITNKQMPTKGP